MVKKFSHSAICKQQVMWVGRKKVPLGIILKRRKRFDDIPLAVPVSLHLVYQVTRVDC